MESIKGMSMNTSLMNARIFDDDAWEEKDGMEVRKQTKVESETDYKCVLNTIKIEPYENETKSHIKIEPHNNDGKTKIKVEPQDSDGKAKIKIEPQENDGKTKIKIEPQDNDVKVKLEHQDSDIKDSTLNNTLEEGELKDSFSSSESANEFICKTPPLLSKIKADSDKVVDEIFDESPYNKELFNTLRIREETPIKTEDEDANNSAKNTLKSAKRTVFNRHSPYKRIENDVDCEKRMSAKSRLGPKVNDYCPRKLPRPIQDLETDPGVLSRREKQIEYGKNTIGYDYYIRYVPREERKLEDPQTPDKFQKYSRRGWDGLIKQWRLKLHKYDPADTKIQDIETDPGVLLRREKQIEYGKNTIGYDNYTRYVPREERKSEEPQTPDKFQKYSRRGWDRLIKQWRLNLHKYDPADTSRIIFMEYNPSTIFDIRNTGNNEDTNPQDHNDGILLSLLNKNGRLGAAYYSFQEKTLNVYEEMSDISPQYLISATLYREVSPKYILAFGNLADEYVKVLIEFSNAEADTTVTTNSLRLPENFFLLSLKEFTYEASKTIVSNINIASNILECSDIKKELYIHSCINMNHRLSIQALGGLYKYLEKNWSMFGIEAGDDHFLHINQVTMENHVLLDNTSFKALQIFSPRSHDAGFKRGQESSSREGLSIYKLFIFGCKSKIGQSQLRNILLSPINNKQELEKRLSFISFVLHPGNSDFIDNIQENIKQFCDVRYVSLILGKIQNARATNRDWNILHKMIYHTIFINEISKPYREKSELLVELNAAITDDLQALQESISNALDFIAGAKRGRPVIKFGLDENLDAKLLRQQDIAKHVTAAARFAVHDLPEFINECKVVYLPEMGHLMAIKEWEPDCDPERLQYLGYQYMFSLGGTIHYKNPLCVELDKRLGDINAEIIDHENRILRRLSAFTLKYNKDIRDSIRIIALMDCLIAMAKVSQQNNYVKPQLNNDRIYKIEKCRHPLMEQILTSFEANDFTSGGSHSHMKIITGANGSGKSIFLKQTVLTVFLAHIGCYVPAKKANIGLVHSIHCRMHTTESAVVRLSSFMIDIAQTSQAIYYAAPSSFIIMDEFGRGTLDDDGIILLASFLKNFLEKKNACPHIIVSTHLQRVLTLLPESKYLEYLKMEHTMESDTFCFLHKIAKGVSNSFAFDIAATILNKDKIDKARRNFQYLQENKQIRLPAESLRIQEIYLNKELNVLPTDQ